MTLKTELIRRVWEKVNAGRQGYKERLRYDDIERIINTFLEEIAQCMIDGEDINLRGFGSFVSNIRKGRIAHDTFNNQLIRLPERRVIKFNISKKIDKDVRGEKKYDRISE